MVDRDFPGHHVTHGLDESSLDEIGRMERIDDLTSNIDGRPYPVYFQLLLRSDGDFGHIGDIAGMRELEGEAETCSFGKLVTTVFPIRHIPHGFDDADRPFRIERGAKGNFRESRDR